MLQAILIWNHKIRYRTYYFTYIYCTSPEVPSRQRLPQQNPQTRTPTALSVRYQKNNDEKPNSTFVTVNGKKMYRPGFRALRDFQRGEESTG